MNGLLTVRRKMTMSDEKYLRAPVILYLKLKPGESQADALTRLEDKMLSGDVEYDPGMLEQKAEIVQA